MFKNSNLTNAPANILFRRV